MYFLIGISLLLVLTMESSSPGVLAMATIGKFGAVLAPIIGRELGRYNRESVFVIFSLISLTSGFLTLFLPETLGRALPDSIEDGISGEAFDRGETAFTSCICKK